GDLACEVLPGHPLRHARYPRVHERQHGRLAAPVDAAAHEPLDGWGEAEKAALARAHRAVVARHDPRRRPLEGGQPSDLRLDSRDELERRGAGADDRDAAADELVRVVPGRRVELGAGERVETRDLWDRRLAERAHRADEDARGERATGGLERPALG